MLLGASFDQEQRKLAYVGSPILVLAIGKQNVFTRGQLRAVLVGNAKARLEQDLFASIVAAVPEPWLQVGYGGIEVAAVRQAYVDYLGARLDGSAGFVGEGERARAHLV